MLFTARHYKGEDSDHAYFIRGYVGIFDRLAAARIGSKGDTAVGFNFLTVPVVAGLLVLLEIWFWNLDVFYSGVGDGRISLDGWTAVFHWGGAIVIGLIGAFLLLAEMFGAGDGDGPTCWLARAWLARPRLVSSRVRVRDSRALLTLATGSCKRHKSGDIERDFAQVYSWLRENYQYRRTISAFLNEKHVILAERIIDERPASPTDEERELVAKIKTKLDDRATVVRGVIDDARNSRSTVEAKRIANNDDKKRASWRSVASAYIEE